MESFPEPCLYFGILFYIFKRIFTLICSFYQKCKTLSNNEKIYSKKMFKDWILQKECTLFYLIFSKYEKALSKGTKWRELYLILGYVHMWWKLFKITVIVYTLQHCAIDIFSVLFVFILYFIWNFVVEYYGICLMFKYLKKKSHLRIWNQLISGYWRFHTWFLTKI